MWLTLVRKSLWHRRLTVLLCMVTVAISVFVVLGFEHWRQQVKIRFAQTVAGVDLVVGARTSPINLLLYSVFRIGNASNNLSHASYAAIAAHPDVAWVVPLSLGDSHRSYRVVGTTTGYFRHFHYGASQPLHFRAGAVFTGDREVVLGAQVAHRLQYQPGQQIVLAHGLHATRFSLHNDHPFTVSGILAPTGTPVDEGLYVSLAGLEALHQPRPAPQRSAVRGSENESEHGSEHESEHQHAHAHDDEPDHGPGAGASAAPVTALLVGLTHKVAAFGVQREINTYAPEALTAILPGVVLMELWQLTGAVEQALWLLSQLVLLAALLGLSAMLLASLRERQGDIAVLRAMGAHPLFIVGLIQAEALLICGGGILLALAGLWAALVGLQDWLSLEYGIVVSSHILTPPLLRTLGLVLMLAFATSLIPALAAYRASLQQRLAER
jgi:putative ABC transport system permease protein